MQVNNYKVFKNDADPNIIKEVILNYTMWYSCLALDNGRNVPKYGENLSADN